MTERETEYLHGVGRRARAVLDELESEAPASSPEEKERRKQIVERLLSVIEDAETALGKRKAR